MMVMVMVVVVDGVPTWPLRVIMVLLIGYIMIDDGDRVGNDVR